MSRVLFDGFLSPFFSFRLFSLCVTLSLSPSLSLPRITILLFVFLVWAGYVCASPSKRHDEDDGKLAISRAIVGGAWRSMGKGNDSAWINRICTVTSLLQITWHKKKTQIKFDDCAAPSSCKWNTISFQTAIWRPNPSRMKRHFQMPHKCYSSCSNCIVMWSDDVTGGKSEGSLIQCSCCPNG